METLARNGSSKELTNVISQSNTVIFNKNVKLKKAAENFAFKLRLIGFSLFLYFFYEMVNRHVDSLYSQASVVPLAISTNQFNTAILNKIIVPYLL